MNVQVVSAISDYTKNYHGVDGLHQLTAGDYSIEGRGSGQQIPKWTVRMFHWFVNLFAQMAYNIHDYHHRIGVLTRSRLHHGEFNRLLGDAFLNNVAYTCTVERTANGDAFISRHPPTCLFHLRHPLYHQYLCKPCWSQQSSR